MRSCSPVLLLARDFEITAILGHVAGHDWGFVRVV